MHTIVGGEESIALGGKLIREGQLVAFPTETVYGLGANAFDADAVRSIYVAKGRPQDNPIIVHIASAAQAESVAEDIPPSAYALFAKFSPGPLTLVLKKAKTLPLVTTGGLDTVGVRIPRHKLALELIQKSGVPLAAPSANISGGVSPTEASHVYEDLNGKIPLILDGGKTQVGIESTVLDLTKATPVVLRPGWVTAEELSEVLGEVVNHKGEVVIAEAPGMKYRHYAPSCPAIAAENPSSAVKRYELLTKEGYNPVIIGSEHFVLNFKSAQVISLGKTIDEHMNKLFSSLREAEKRYDYIIIEYFAGGGRYTALNNRIAKAVGGNII